MDSLPIDTVTDGPYRATGANPPETQMKYLRPFGSVFADPHWWHAPAAFTAIQMALFIVGLVPYIGPLIAFVPGLLFAVWLQGWVAMAQSRALIGVPGLPEPFATEYLMRGFRSWSVMFVWSLPVVSIGVIAMVVTFLIKQSNGFDFSGDLFGPIFNDLAQQTHPVFVGVLYSISTGLQVISLLLLVVGPLLHLAVVRTNLAGDWSGLRASEVLTTLRRVPVEAYAGAVLWVILGGVMHALGFLACGVGFWFGQALWFACFGLFWVDVYRLAVHRGAPPASLAYFGKPESPDAEAR